MSGISRLAIPVRNISGQELCGNDMSRFPYWVHNFVNPKLSSSYVKLKLCNPLNLEGFSDWLEMEGYDESMRFI